MKNIGKTIRIMRQLSGLRQGEFAKRLDVSANYISLVENQKRDPSLKFIQKAAEKLNLPVSVFFWEDINTTNYKDDEDKKMAEEINRLYWDVIRSRMQKVRGENGQI